MLRRCPSSRFKKAVQAGTLRRCHVAHLVRATAPFSCETTVANNGKEAVDLFLEGKTFDIVLTDKDMPVMMGPKAIVKIRAVGATEVKIVGVSADLHSEEVFMSAGADVFVPKPMRLEILESMLQEVISKKNKRV